MALILAVSSPAVANQPALDRVSVGPIGGNGAFSAEIAGGMAGDALPSGVSSDGRHMLFLTDERLTLDDNDTVRDLYELDQTTDPATTRLVSTSATAGINSIVPNYVGMSQDGTHLFFTTVEQLDPADTDNKIDIYDRSGGTTTRVSTGPNGGNGPFDAFFGGASPDGIGVAFTTDEQLVASDTDSQSDVYTRAGPTTLQTSVGQINGNGAFGATFAGAGQNSDRIFFHTQEQLTSDDTDSQLDVYEAQYGLGGAGIRRVSRGSLASSGNGASAALFARVSLDGTRVFFHTSEQIDAGDTDSAQDIYVRENGTTTTRVSVGAGAVAGNGAFTASLQQMAEDGSRVFFYSNEQLGDGDTDAQQDIWERNLGTSTTVRTSQGPSGGNGAFPAAFGIGIQFNVSADGTKAFFQTDEVLGDGDTDSFQDIYQRSGSVTTRLSRGIATGSGNGMFPAYFAGAAADGARVAVLTLEALTIDDTNPGYDGYAVSGGQATLGTKGPTGGGNINPFFAGASRDGTRVFFQTNTSMVPDDTDASEDVYYLGVDGVRTSVPAGGTASTGGTATPADPVETSVTSPNAATVSITEQTTTQPAPPGYSLLGWQMNITVTGAPPPPTTNPLVLEFRIDASLLPAGYDEAAPNCGGAPGGCLLSYRNGTVVTPCMGGPTEASPDPCFRASQPGGAGTDLTIKVYTTAASTWNFGLPNGTLVVKKDAQPNDPQDFGFSTGAHLSPSTFSLDDDPSDGTLSDTRTFTNVAPGSDYSVTELVPAGWNQTGATCDDGSPVSDITVSPGETVTCTFTNTNRGQIIVKKNAQPDDPQDFTFTAGAGLSPTSFQLDDDADGTLSDTRTFADVPSGSGYSVAETVPSGWDQTSATCDDGSPVSNIDVAPNETVTCTFTNTKRGQIVVRKNAQPDDPQDFDFTAGGGLSPSSFQLDDDADGTLSDTRTFANVQPGSGYSVAETVPSGWDQTSATCDDGSPVSNIDVAPNETVTCTFNNTKRGQIIVKKNAQPDDPQDFDFTAGGGLSPASFQLDDDADGTLSDTRTFADVPAGSGYSVAETVPSGWDQTSATCDDGSPVSNIDVAPNETVTCTFNNTKRGQIVVTKDAQPDDAQDFNFTAGGGLSPTSFQLDDDSDATLSNTRTFANLSPGSGYSIAETNPAAAGWYLGKASCDDGSPLTNISVSAGETVTCKFTNSVLYARPSTGTPFRIPLVNAYRECTSPNSTHVTPLDYPACTGPQMESTQLKTRAAGTASGLVKLKVIPGNTSTPADEADVSVSAQARDVQRVSDGADYVGNVIVAAVLRVTDRANDTEGVASATVRDFEFAAPMSCTATPGAQGSNCSLTTSFDTLVPNFDQEGKLAILSALEVSIKDTGPNGTYAPPVDPIGLGCPPTCGDGDEKMFMRQGLFTP